MSRCVFDEDIFERLTSLSLTCHLSHTRGISLFSDDDDVLTELSESADEADKRWRQASSVRSPIKSGTSPSLREQCS